jgi:hypothetical protein
MLWKTRVTLGRGRTIGSTGARAAGVVDPLCGLVRARLSVAFGGYKLKDTSMSALIFRFSIALWAIVGVAALPNVNIAWGTEHDASVQDAEELAAHIETALAVGAPLRVVEVGPADEAADALNIRLSNESGKTITSFLCELQWDGRACPDLEHRDGAGFLYGMGDTSSGRPSPPVRPNEIVDVRLSATLVRRLRGLVPVQYTGPWRLNLQLHVVHYSDGSRWLPATTSPPPPN